MSQNKECETTTIVFIILLLNPLYRPPVTCMQISIQNLSQKNQFS